MVTALLLSTVTPHKHRTSLLRINQKFHHKFSVFECMKIAQNYAQVFTFVSHCLVYFKMVFLFVCFFVLFCFVLFFAGRHFFIRCFDADL